MARPDLRPMSVGEILDRTASLYREKFALFFGISAVPHVFVLAWALARLKMLGSPARSTSLLNRELLILLNSMVEGWFISFLAQCATAYAIGELYLERKVSITSAFRRLGTGTWTLLACSILRGLAIVVGSIVFFVPGILTACRLMVALPSAVLEGLGVRQAFARSFSLTDRNVARAFAIWAFYLVLRVIHILFILFLTRYRIKLSRVDPGIALALQGLLAVVDVSLSALIEPFLAIAATLFYFDLRVRKEALDLQLMMNDGAKIPAGPIGATST
jgi:glycerophosphoryl diester phosphodiesterase family protein